MTFVPHTEAQRSAMLARIGVADFDELLAAIPAEMRLNREVAVPAAHGEVELDAALRRLYNANTYIPPERIFCGGGAYCHHVPAIVDEISSRSEFYSAYTPYQPEVSQGYLQAIYEYQSYICLLTGMDMSNASSYDSGTTLADAVQMVKSHFKHKRPQVLFAPGVSPEAREVVATYNHGMQMQFADLPGTADGRCDPDALAAALSDQTGAVVFQYPDYYGYLDEELEGLIAQVRASGAAAIVLFYPYAAGLLKTPGELGADIVCGDAQCFGNYLSFGGPSCGFLACREAFVRVLPGRLIGRTTCIRDGAPGEGFVMTLQAREQHIRRDKATSNICTNQALLALRVCVYLSAVGRDGFRALAARCHENACSAYDQLIALTGVEPLYAGRQFFNEFTLRLPQGRAAAVHAALLNANPPILTGFVTGVQSDGSAGSSTRAGSEANPPSEDARVNAPARPEDCLTLAFTEVHGPDDIAALIAAVQEVL
jgi:glycine dehydrogenase subunit 1